MKEEILKEVTKTIENHHLEKVGNLYLTTYQKQVLLEHSIPFENCQNQKELLFYLQEYDEEDEDLKEVIDEIAEFTYYNETRK